MWGKQLGGSKAGIPKQLLIYDQIFSNFVWNRKYSFLEQEFVTLFQTKLEKKISQYYVIPKNLERIGNRMNEWLCCVKILISFPSNIE